jgi:hypothetical protein
LRIKEQETCLTLEEHDDDDDDDKLETERLFFIKNAFVGSSFCDEIKKYRVI